MLINTLLADWRLEAAIKIAATPTSDIFKVTQANGEMAVLKILSDTGKADEINAAATLNWYQGTGSVNLIQSNADALLLEYADGPELSELVYTGRDDEAMQVACDVVRLLHIRRKRKAPAELTYLRTRFHALFTEAETTVNPLVREAALVAESLLQTTKIEIPLHGDLHHHNIINSGRGWLAIDPKGLLGDPAYEVSNLFANPLRAENVCNQIERTQLLLNVCAATLDYPKDRIAKFSFVHNVLAAIWSGTTDNRNNTSLIVAQNIREQFSP